MFSSQFPTEISSIPTTICHSFQTHSLPENPTNMQLTTTAIILYSGLLAAAAPTADASQGLVPGIECASSVNSNHTGASPLVERSPNMAIITFCEHAKRRGRCLTQRINAKACYNFVPFWDNRISSIYVNEKAVCDLYANPVCRGASTWFNSQGNPDLAGSGLNDKGSSIRCRY